MVEALVAALLASGLEDAAEARDGVAHHPPLPDRQRQGLLAVDVLAGSRGAADVDRMPVVRRPDDHRVDVVAREKIPEVVVRIAGRGAFGAFLVREHLVPRRVSASAVRVADREDLDLVARHEAAQVRTPHSAATDEAHRQASGGCEPLAERRRGNDEGHGGRGRHGAEERAARRRSMQYWTIHPILPKAAVPGHFGHSPQSRGRVPVRRP